jgi:hypothetical protein
VFNNRRPDVSLRIPESISRLALMRAALPPRDPNEDDDEEEEDETDEDREPAVIREPDEDE